MDQRVDEPQNNKQCMSRTLFSKTDDKRNKKNPCRRRQRRDNEEKNNRKRFLVGSFSKVSDVLHLQRYIDLGGLWRYSSPATRLGGHEHDVCKSLSKQARYPQNTAFVPRCFSTPLGVTIVFCIFDPRRFDTALRVTSPSLDPCVMRCLLYTSPSPRD